MKSLQLLQLQDQVLQLQGQQEQMQVVPLPVVPVFVVCPSHAQRAVAFLGCWGGLGKKGTNQHQHMDMLISMEEQFAEIFEEKEKKSILGKECFRTVLLKSVEGMRDRWAG